MTSNSVETILPYWISLAHKCDCAQRVSREECMDYKDIKMRATSPLESLSLQDALTNKCHCIKLRKSPCTPFGRDVRYELPGYVSTLAS